MDMFMDKLAHKKTAQEIIRANSEADAEEMERLKEQTAEYREILGQMQKLVADCEHINRLTENAVSGIEQSRGSAGELEKLGTAVEEMKTDIAQIRAAAARMESETAELKSAVAGMEPEAAEMKSAVEQMKSETAEMKSAVAEMKEEAAAKAAATDENTHRECVKVYRNVQAVVVDENGKQKEAIVAAVGASKGRLGAVLGVSIAALIVALGGVVFQVLTYLSIL